MPSASTAPFDYSSTFISFLFFAMPVFWFAVLLKEFGAIKLNGWISNWGFKIYTIGSESTPLPQQLLQPAVGLRRPRHPAR